MLDGYEGGVMHRPLVGGNSENPTLTQRRQYTLYSYPMFESNCYMTENTHQLAPLRV